MAPDPFILAGGVAVVFLFATLLQVIVVLARSFVDKVNKDQSRLEERVELLEENEEVRVRGRFFDVEASCGELNRIPVGHEGAHKYHKFILGALETIFYPNLRKPEKEQRLHAGRKRVDIVFDNVGNQGFFADLRIRHRIKCPYVFFECKNYSEDPGNPEFDQLTGRFSKLRGEFGILVCRKITNRHKTLQHSRDPLNDGRGYVLVLDDSDIEALLRMRARQDFAGVNNYMGDLYRRLVM
jgi:hypothetical protein